MALATALMMIAMSHDGLLIVNGHVFHWKRTLGTLGFCCCIWTAGGVSALYPRSALVQWFTKWLKHSYALPPMSADFLHICAPILFYTGNYVLYLRLFVVFLERIQLGFEESILLLTADDARCQVLAAHVLELLFNMRLCLVEVLWLSGSCCEWRLLSLEQMWRSSVRF